MLYLTLSVGWSAASACVPTMLLTPIIAFSHLLAPQSFGRIAKSLDSLQRVMIHSEYRDVIAFAGVAPKTGSCSQAQCKKGSAITSRLLLVQ